uniref:Uncharacterized protein n=1 Tax=Arundo donax TaxID=35708 RepID=A0A0A8YYR2_ARUDO
MWFPREAWSTGLQMVYLLWLSNCPSEMMMSARCWDCQILELILVTEHESLLLRVLRSHGLKMLTCKPN